MRKALPAWALLTAGVLASCGSTATNSSGTTSASDALYFSTTSLPVAYLAESYDAPMVVAGGAGPYGLRVGSGTLPPGLTLRNMRLSGTPTKVGTYTFVLEASDANLSSKVKSYTLNVSELPTLALKPQLPSGEIRGETRIPLNITGPRTVRAARIAWDLPEGVTVTRVQPADSGGVLFWKQAGRTLTVDVGFKAVPRANARVALVTLRPPKAVTLDATRFGYEARDGAGKVLAETKLPELPKPAATTPAATPTPGSAASGSTPVPAAPSGPSTGTPAPAGTPTPSGTPSGTTAPGTTTPGGGQP